MAEETVVLGMISGSSLDGLDLAAVRFSGDLSRTDWEVLGTSNEPFPADLYNDLKTASDLPARALFALEARFSRYCADQINAFIHKISADVALVASHGHTVFHDPPNGYTVQLGNGGAMAALTGVPCMSDFRINDVALGGEGAPVAPIVEKHLFHEIGIFLNLGGIANISFHGADGVTAFDVVPCNQLLNHVARKRGMPFDDRGRIAAQGRIIEDLLSLWDQNPYFAKNPPKSMDNSWVRDQFFDDLDDGRYALEDLMRTSVEFIIRKLKDSLPDTIHDSIAGPVQIMITGGGAHNDFLVDCLSACLKPLGYGIHRPKREWIDYKEAILMALMGYLRMNGQPNTLPSVTGASKPTCGGALYLP